MMRSRVRRYVSDGEHANPLLLSNLHGMTVTVSRQRMDTTKPVKKLPQDNWGLLGHW
jgi:hypothetical protein